jgi:hypothetical protein
MNSEANYKVWRTIEHAQNKVWGSPRYQPAAVAVLHPLGATQVLLDVNKPRGVLSSQLGPAQLGSFHVGRADVSCSQTRSKSRRVTTPAVVAAPLNSVTKDLKARAGVDYGTEAFPTTKQSDCPNNGFGRLIRSQFLEAAEPSTMGMRAFPHIFASSDDAFGNRS